MKFKSLIVITLCLFSLFVSCKKDISPNHQTTGTEQFIERESTIIADNILEWLSSQENSTDSARIGIINSLYSNMLLSNMYVEEFREEENFIIVPLDPTYFSKNLDTSTVLPLQYLLLVEDSTGMIRRGDLVFFYPNGSQISELPQNSFSDFFNHQKFPVDGTFTLLNLSDIKQYEMDFENELPTQHRLWEPRAPLEIPEGSFCIDWYLVTTTYWSDGTYDVDESYLYTTCGHSFGGGGGGGGYTPNFNGTPVTKDVNYCVINKNGNNRFFTLNAYYTLSGNTYSDPSLNKYTGSGIIPQSTQFVVLWGNSNFNILPGTSWYAQYSQASNVYGLINSKLAKATYSGQFHFINQPSPNIEIYSEPKYWPASTSLQ